jgi:hypothetical protein
MDGLFKADAAKIEFRSHLIEGRYRQGEHLSVSHMASVYGVSRPIIRGFFEVLVSEGLLERRGDVFLVFHLTAEQIWQAYKLYHWIAREAPRRFIALNPYAATFPIFCEDADPVKRTEGFFESAAAICEGQTFAGVVRRNNAQLRRLRHQKQALVLASGVDVDDLIDALSALDLPRYDTLLDQYIEFRTSKVHELVRISRS